MKMEHTHCSETLAYEIQTPGNYPEENVHLSGKFRVDLNLFGLSILKPTCFPPKKKKSNYEKVISEYSDNILMATIGMFLPFYSPNAQLCKFA